MEIEKLRSAGYLRIANIVILLIGLVLVLAGYLLSRTGFDLSTVLINVGSGTLVVAVIFFLGKLLYIDPQEEIKERLKAIESKVETARAIERFFARREELQRSLPLPEFLDSARREVLFIGLSHHNFSEILEPEVRKLIVDRRCRVGFTVISATLPTGEENPLVKLTSNLLENPVLSDEINLTIDKLKIFKASLTEEHRKNMEVRGIYKSVLTLSVIIVDGSEQSGKIQVELLPHQFDTPSRPGFVMSFRDDEQLYRLLCERYMALWEQHAGNVLV